MFSKYLEAITIFMMVSQTVILYAYDLTWHYYSHILEHLEKSVIFWFGPSFIGFFGLDSAFPIIILPTSTT